MFETVLHIDSFQLLVYCDNCCCWVRRNSVGILETTGDYFLQDWGCKEIPIYNSNQKNNLVLFAVNKATGNREKLMAIQHSVSCGIAVDSEGGGWEGKSGGMSPTASYLNRGLEELRWILHMSRSGCLSYYDRKLFWQCRGHETITTLHQHLASPGITCHRYHAYYHILQTKLNGFST